MSPENQLSPDLKYFIGCALTGILSNPIFASPEMKKYLLQKNLDHESLAVESALRLMEVITRLQDVMNKQEEQEKAAKEATEKMVQTARQNVQGGQNV